MEQQPEEAVSDAAEPGASRRAGEPEPETPVATGPVLPPSPAAPTPPPSPASTPVPRSPLSPSIPAAERQSPTSGTPAQPAGASPVLRPRRTPPLTPRERVPPSEIIGPASDGRTAESAGTQHPLPETAGVPAASQIDPSAMAPSEMSVLWNQLTALGFIVSGGFAILLKRQPTRWNVKAGVVTSGVSLAAAAIAIVIYSVSLLFMPPPELVYFSATTFSLTIGLLLFTLLEMAWPPSWPLA
ncbi:uncharacterized protein [Mobula birostris]|uniref:uncharacterized protein n=1 Tax=Mobula birostris TaxID=1983395 RepID=UPI003B28669F